MRVKNYLFGGEGTRLTGLGFAAWASFLCLDDDDDDDEEEDEADEDRFFFLDMDWLEPEICIRRKTKFC